MTRTPEPHDITDEELRVAVRTYGIEVDSDVPWPDVDVVDRYLDNTASEEEVHEVERALADSQSFRLGILETIELRKQMADPATRARLNKAIESAKHDPEAILRKLGIARSPGPLVRFVRSVQDLFRQPVTGYAIAAVFAVFALSIDRDPGDATHDPIAAVSSVQLREVTRSGTPDLQRLSLEENQDPARLDLLLTSRNAIDSFYMVRATRSEGDHEFEILFNGADGQQGGVPYLSLFWAAHRIDRGATYSLVVTPVDENYDPDPLQPAVFGNVIFE